MRDEELRRLERQSQERGDASTEARRLRELVRRGDLAPERLELAAYVGHEAARLALEGQVAAPPEAVDEWLRGLARFGREACMRAAIVLCRELSRYRSHYERWAEDDAGRRILEAAEACFVEPTDANKQALDRALEPREGRYYGGGRGGYALASLVRAEDSFDDNFASLVEQAVSPHAPVHPRTARDDIRGDLAPWALGELDPVATRWQREGKRFSSEEDEIIRSVAFSPDGTRVVVSNRTGHVRLRAFPSGELIRELPRVSREVFVAAFSPDGSRVATGDSSGHVRLFVSETGAEVATIAFGDEAIYGLAFVGEDRVAVGAIGGKAAILELTTGKVVVELAGHGRTVSALDVSASGERVATTSGDGNVRVFDSRTGALVRTFEGVAAEDVAFLPDGRLVTCSGSIATLRDPVTDASDLFETGGTTIHAVAASPTGDVFAAAPSNRAPIFVWDASSGAVRKRFAWDLSMPMALAFSPDGRHLLMGDRGGGVRVFEV